MAYPLCRGRLAALVFNILPLQDSLHFIPRFYIPEMCITAWGFECYSVRASPNQQSQKVRSFIVHGQHHPGVVTSLTVRKLADNYYYKSHPPQRNE
jgi:hypothetical protein